MNLDKKSPAQMTYQQQADEDEISLVDIVRLFLRRKKIIFGITVLVVCIGLIYAFSSKRVYEVETILLPPSHEDIQPLSVLDENKVNSNSVYESFISNANSRQLRKKFFDEYKLLESISNISMPVLTSKDVNDIFESFSKILIVKTDKKSENTRISLEGTDDKKLGDWLDSFIVMVNEETKKQLIRDIQANLDSKIKNINTSIASKRSNYKKRREDELGRLEEALQIALNLGIRDYNNVNSLTSNNNNLSIYMQDKKIYMQGTRVLQAEIMALKNRKSDDIYIEGLRDLQEQLTRLETIAIDKDKLQTVIVDKKAVVNVEPIRPKRLLIVILSLILGGILGIFTVFILEFISNLKKQINSVGAA